MTFPELERRNPEAAEAFKRLVRDEQDGSVAMPLDAWTFTDFPSGLIADDGRGDRWRWSNPDWIDNN